MKTIIIGNCGSGMSRLAERLAEIDDSPVIHLNELFWEPGGLDRKRPDEAVSRLIGETRRLDSWIVEGVFGQLAERFTDQADFLVWLDMDWELCRERLASCGSESKRPGGRGLSPEGVRRLIQWASGYYVRGGLCSRWGHAALFRSFCNEKLHVRSETGIGALLRIYENISHGSAMNGTDGAREEY